MADEATKKADSEERERKKEEAVASGVLLRSRVKSVPISTYIRPAARWVLFFSLARAANPLDEPKELEHPWLAF